MGCRSGRVHSAAGGMAAATVYLAWAASCSTHVVRDGGLKWWCSTVAGVGYLGLGRRVLLPMVVVEGYSVSSMESGGS
ncbi:hypothetical protein Dimus_033732, partial [Dionaea muscipula]